MRKQRMQANQCLLGILCVEFVFDFSPFFGDRIKPGCGKSLQRVCGLRMDHAPAKVHIITRIRDNQA